MNNSFHRVVDTVLCADKDGTPAYLCDDGEVRVQSNRSTMVTIFSEGEIKASSGYPDMTMQQKHWLQELFEDAREFFREHGSKEARELLKSNDHE